MRTITRNQMTLVNNFVAENNLPFPKFKMGDSVIKLHEWSLDALCALAMTFKDTGDDSVAMVMHEFKMLLLLEVL